MTSIVFRLSHLPPNHRDEVAPQHAAQCEATAHRLTTITCPKCMHLWERKRCGSILKLIKMKCSEQDCNQMNLPITRPPNTTRPIFPGVIAF
ncbi:hypothetical protein DPMN_074685 [Dreissena polymorpha]|uniref:Uncharacterized protein n=1 Tax=Dreissena polymorpha TaxID=45954 RepID=A0A9D4BKV8_DREPO|nr:hypothetical protein DPMN_074685 [Dreissena polymorpha]